MESFRSLLVVLLLSLSVPYIVNAEYDYVEILKPRGELNGTTFDVDVDISSGILNTEYESRSVGKFRLKVVPCKFFFGVHFGGGKLSVDPL